MNTYFVIHRYLHKAKKVKPDEGPYIYGFKSNMYKLAFLKSLCKVFFLKSPIISETLRGKVFYGGLPLVSKVLKAIDLFVG